MTWLLLGFGAWLATLLGVVGVLSVSGREGRREEAEESMRTASPVAAMRRAS